MPMLRRISRVLAFLTIIGGAMHAEEKAAPALFQRIVLLGASATAGFEMSEPFGGPKTPQFALANYIEAALVGTHEAVATQASSLLFLNVQETMEKQVAATVAARPSLVIALDALFWFCYGKGVTSEQRLARFETGLRLLEGIEAPLVVGDLPDATRAVGGILRKAEQPDLAILAQCNARLNAWAREHKNVILFPLAQMMAAAARDEELVLGARIWPKGKSAALLRADHLHPTRHGLAALAVTALETASTASVPPIAETDLRRDLEAVYAAGLARGEVAAKVP